MPSGSLLLIIEMVRKSTPSQLHRPEQQGMGVNPQQSQGKIDPDRVVRAGDVEFIRQG